MRRAGAHRTPLSRALASAAVTTVVVAGGLRVAAPAGATPTRPAAIETATARFQQWGTVEEQQFVDRINQLRSSLGLTPLSIDPELTAQARRWAQTMKDAGRIFHTTTLDAGISADWEKLGENVGVGGTVDALYDAFVASPTHYENLVDPVYRYIGVGVVWDGARMFTAHRFMSLLPAAPPTTAAPRRAPAPAPASPPPDELASTDPAPEPDTADAPPAPEVAEASAPPPAPEPTVPAPTGDRIRLVLENLVGLRG